MSETILLNKLFKKLEQDEQQTLLLCLDNSLEYQAFIEHEGEELFIGVNVFVPDEQIIEEEGYWTLGRKYE